MTVSKVVSLNHGDRKWLLADRPVVEVGAGSHVYADKGCYFQNSSFTQDCTQPDAEKKKKTMLLIYILSHQVLTG
jgi:hypothetical protein